jgi:hypothetical protein
MSTRNNKCDLMDQEKNDRKAPPLQTDLRPAATQHEM